MDKTIKPEQIADVLKQFDRQKESEKHDTASTNAREVASAIGTDTPLTVLLDIRHIMTELRDAVIDNGRRSDEHAQLMLRVLKEQQEANDQKHREMLAFMNKVSDSATRGHLSSVSATSSHARLSLTPESDGRYYYKGDEIKTSQSIIGCFLMHLDILVSRSLPASGDITDTSVMELKDWSSAVTVLKEVESTITPNSGPLALPKMSSDECKHTLNTVATTVQGRAVTCKNEHIGSLIVNCPTVSRCVEEIRLRALACPGIIGSSRLRSLSALSFPYVTREGVLNITNSSPKPIGSRIVHDKVKHMNAHQKKVYAQLVLCNIEKPVIACTTALKCVSDFKKWRESR